MPSETARAGCATCSARQGHESDIYALTIDDDLRSEVRPFADPGARRGEVTIFHFALPSPMTDAFAPARRRARAAVSQHHAGGVLRAVLAGLFRLAAIGRRELTSLVGQVDLALGDSEFNRRELEALGFAPTGVLPIAVDTERITRAPRRPALEKILGDGLINILFVGRIVPNKRIDDHIRLAEVYKRYVDSYYRFIFVGRYDGVPAYYAQVRALIAQYRMLPDRFWFTGPVPDEDLARSIGGPTRMSRSASTRASACRSSKPWPPTCRCWPTPPARFPKRWAARACSSRPRISKWRRKCSACSYTIDLARARPRRTAAAPEGFRARTHRGAVDRNAFCIEASLKIAFIVQRYGAEILGGSDTTAG